MLAEYVEQGQRKRPAKASSAGTKARPSPAHTSAPAPATAGNEEQLAVISPEDASADRRYGRNIVMRVIKPLYGISEAGTHWWVTYFGHHLAAAYADFDL
ncbi:hypothetical protein E4U34_001731 [Claviceps purpurea]|nr:hypothetical protein E4U11_001426 [Claviceps purpurea]KAG6221953.1 hypothetical protein E4U34_001731 [Claviceps purpurea]